MKQNKLVIVVLVVIGVLFVVGLSSGLFRKKEPDHDKLTMSKAESYKNKWVATLDTKMSSFSDPLDKRRLPNKAKCPQPPGPDLGIVLGKDGSIKLDNGLECSIKIAASKDGEDIEKATLTVENNAATLKVAYPGTEACTTDRGIGVSLKKKIVTPKVGVNIGKIKQPNVKKNLSRPQFELIVAYIPEESEEMNEVYCRAVKEVKLSVLEKGGKILMKCVGCDRQKNKAIRVKMN